MRIGILADRDLAVQAAEFQRGQRADRSYYQVDELEKWGHQLVQLREAPIRDRWAHKIEHRLGYPVRAALDIPTARSCDIVLALLETQGWAYGAIRSVISLPPLVTLECWLAEDIHRASGANRPRLVRRAQRLGDILSLTENQRQILSQAGLPRQNLHTIPFAVATDFYTPGLSDERSKGLPGGHEVLFVGQDRGRDFDTFLSAMNMLEGEVSALLVTKPELIQDRILPRNVVLHGTVDHLGYRDLLRRASVVVVPTFDLAYPTGQSVAMEAAATLAPVVVTRTTAMLEYIDESNAEMPPVGDAAALAESVRRVLSDPKRSGSRAASLRDKILKKHTGNAMWRAALPVLEGVAARL